jgi:hypothetical protein
VRGQKRAVALQDLRVVRDPSCPLGHHVFAHSANNGPVGDAIVHEPIPELEKRFRAIPAAGARFVTAHSSGGWSSLWLQVTGPTPLSAFGAPRPTPSISARSRR